MGVMTETTNEDRLLLHACCGPCSLEPVRILRSEGVDPVVFYANSNIHPAEEYARRLATLREWAAGAGLEVVEGVYDPEAWETTAGRIGNAADAKFGVITNEEGDLEGDASPARAAREARSRDYYPLRFEEAARYAREHGYSALGTTLSVSPYPYTRIIREDLQRACAREGSEARFAARAAVRAAHADERAAAEAERARTRAEKQAYADKQAKKRAILKALREQQ